MSPRLFTTCAIALALALVAGCAGRNREPEEPQLAGGESPAAFHRAIGMTLVRAGQPQRALPYLQRQVRLEPRRPEPLCDLARAYMDLGLWHQAGAAVDRAVALAPRHAEAHALRGVLLDVLGDHAAAEAAHERAVALDPGNAAYHNNLGFSRYLAGRYPQALAALGVALRLEPGRRRVHNNLGFVYGGLGRMELAREHFRLGGSVGEATNNLGLVHEARGELAEAHRAYAAASAATPPVAQARGNLERLRARMASPPAAAEGRQ